MAGFAMVEQIFKVKKKIVEGILLTIVIATIFIF